MKLKQKLAINYIRARLNILSLVSPKTAAQKAFDLFCTPMQRARKKASAIFGKGEKLSFRLDNHTVRGHRWFPQQDLGSPVKRVLIAHGFESNSRNFDQYIGALLKKGYEVLAFDAPAHGQSGGRQITIPLYVKTIQTIQEKYGPIHAYMGHSFGGLAISLFLEQTNEEEMTDQSPNPDRPLASSGQPDGTRPVPRRLVLIAPVSEMTTAVRNFYQLLHLNEEVRKEFDELALETGGRPFSYYSLRRAIPQIPADILWVQDEEDIVTPLKDALLVKADQHPHVHFLITSGLGHRKVYRDPEVIGHVIEFL
jgi:pimeloyl-ACP methyl ester carboxylesterase